jgi:small-conductance mechanosensitive channel
MAQASATDTLVQLAVLATALILALILVRPVRGVLDHFFEARPKSDGLLRTASLLGRLVLPALGLGLIGAGSAAALDFGYDNEILRAVSSLLAAWLLIRISTRLIAEPFWAHSTAVVAWTLAAMNILHLLDPTLAFLDGFGVTFGEGRISVLSIFKALAMIALLLSVALALSKFIQLRISRVPNLTPSIQVLLSQLARFGLIVAAFLVSATSVGIDLSSFAVIGGAVGVGIGFGLQKVVSNLISGVILLLDGSIKPGDVIEVGETYGEVNSLGARYTSVITPDGTEWLIPNEDLITQQVTNWSYSSKFVRRRVPIGIAYNSDLDLATQLILDAAAETDRILADPIPKCLLKGFGDNSVDLELRYWINDPEQGVSNIADAVLRCVWKKFQQNEIEIPFPQRDLYIKNDSLKVTVVPT